MSNKVLKVLSNPLLLVAHGVIGLTRLIKNDELYLKILYYCYKHKRLNLKNPQTFCEKLQWLKLYNHNPEYTIMVDKYAVKDYVANIIGSEHIIPTLGVWSRPEDIEWDKLPKRFVLKCTHDSGTIIIVKDKTKLNKQETIKKLNYWLKRDYYLQSREWPYKNVPRRVIAEQFMDPNPNTKDLPNYNFICFNGEVKGLYIATDHNVLGDDAKYDFFDADFNHISIQQGYDNVSVMPEKPQNFEQLKNVAEQLSKGLPHVGVGLYDLGDNVFLGELAIFHMSSMAPFEPDEWYKCFDEMLKSPNEKCECGIIKFEQGNNLSIVHPDLYDFKFFTFNGAPKVLLFCSERKNGTSKWDFYDMDMNLIQMEESHHKNSSININEIISRDIFEEMKHTASSLAKDIPFVSVDLYFINGIVYFGEMTFYTGSGFHEYNPDKYDWILGDMLLLPSKQEKK